MLKIDLRKACLFSNTFHFIENLCAIIDHLEFDRIFQNIYHSEFQLKKENISTSKASFSDLFITNKNKKFKTQFYGKIDAFSFSVICMLHLDSNIPSNIYYPSIGIEILRFDGTTSDKNTFVIISYRVLKKMRKQETKPRPMISTLNKNFGKNFTVEKFHWFYTRSSKLHHCFSIDLNQNYKYTHLLVAQLVSVVRCFLLVVFWLPLFVCLFVCLFVQSSRYYCFFRVIYICFYVFAFVSVPMSWHFLLKFQYNLTVFQKLNLVLFTYFVLLFAPLLVHTCISMHLFLHFVKQMICYICFFCSLYIHIICSSYIYSLRESNNYSLKNDSLKNNRCTWLKIVCPPT